MAEQEQNQQQEPEGGEGPQGEGQQPEAPRFNQADVDRIIKERLERERTRYADYEDLKKSAAELKKLQDAQLGEKERLEKQLTEAQQAAAQAATAAQAREAEINSRLIRAEVRVVAAELGFANPDDAYALADLAGVEVAEDGSVSHVKKALEKLAKEKAYLLKTETAPVGTPPRGQPRSAGQSAMGGPTEPTRPAVRW